MNTSASQKLKLAVQGHTAVITVDNPAANTWDTQSLPALRDLVGELNADRDIYALVLTGAGEKFFSAGADLKLFAAGDPGAAGEMARLFGEAFEALADFPWAAAWKSRWLAIVASRRSRPAWPCPRRGWVCCPAPAARSAWRGWSARAGPSV